jgi:hypothetical protein
MEQTERDAQKNQVKGADGDGVNRDANPLHGFRIRLPTVRSWQQPRKLEEQNSPKQEYDDSRQAAVTS